MTATAAPLGQAGRRRRRAEEERLARLGPALAALGDAALEVEHAQVGLARDRDQLVRRERLGPARGGLVGTLRPSIVSPASESGIDRSPYRKRRGNLLCVVEGLRRGRRGTGSDSEDIGADFRHEKQVDGSSPSEGSTKAPQPARASARAFRIACSAEIRSAPSSSSKTCP
jgi:hypothetical protein